MANRWWNKETVTDFIFLGSKITADDDFSHETERRLLLGRKAMTNLDSILKTRDITLLTKVCLVKAVVFPVWSSSPVWMWELDHKESWVPKNWCSWTVVSEKILESPLDCKEIKPVDPKGNQSWIFIGKTDAEAEAPILWPSDAKNWLTGKGPDLGKDWKQEEKGNDREWEGWMTSPTQWTWVWASSSSWWRTGKTCMLQSMGFQRVGHNWGTELTDWHSLPGGSVVKNLPASQIWPLDQEDPWRRNWQPTPVFLPGESHGQRRLAGYSP